MNAEKIVENMKAVLKRTKRRKSQNKKHCDNKNKVEESNSDDDQVISELMTKNWLMKTPPVMRKELNDEKDSADEIVKQKVNAFEKLMSSRGNLNSPIQPPKSLLTSEQNVADSNKKVKRTKTKKGTVLNSSTDFNGSLLDAESPIRNGHNDILPANDDSKKESTKKRTRINDACLEKNSKKQKTKSSKMLLDSNENALENNEILSDNSQPTDRPKRSCANRVNYALIAGSPDKNSPEKKSTRHKPEVIVQTVLVPNENLPEKEVKENIKLAPLFAKKTKKSSHETVLQESNVKTEVPSPKITANVEASRPRRSCAGKVDYSLFNKSPDKRSPDKQPLRPKPEIENASTNGDILEQSSTNIAPVFAKKAKKSVDQIDNSNLQDSNEKTPETPQSGRPKRSCASNRIDYSQLLGSPDKISPEKKGRQKANKDPDVIIVDVNSPVKKAKANVKLAPLFVKKIPKPAIDPAVLEARRNFLLSELPANLRAPIEKQRQFEDDILSNEMVAFPSISHVTQAKHEAKLYDVIENILDISKVRIIEEDVDSITTKNMVMKCGVLTDCTSVDYTNPVMRNGLNNGRLEPIIDIKEAVRNVKDSCGNFPVNRCFKQILNKLKCAKESEDVNDNGISQLSSSFVELFKPSSYEEILIGLEPVKSLQDFLNTWNDRSAKYDNYDSDDSSSRQSMKGMNNCVVLSGKNGSGKTSSVYALANDLNYEVIEINAGSRRSGKKILQDLLEATQSHRVEKNLMDDDASTDNFQNDVVDKKTIILIEDAELTFENDDGFISSIQQLINISKRPVILTTNDAECQHLQKFIQHNQIIYDSPKNFVTKYLALISIATANYRVDEVEIEKLYTSNRYDLRKTINEIEFFIRSESSSVNSGSLMGLFCDTEKTTTTTNRHQKGSSSQLAFHSQRDLSTLRSRSSFISDYSAMLSCSQQVFEDADVSYQQRNLMNEMADFFERSNLLLKVEYQNNELARRERELIISSSISSEICSLNTSTRAKNVDYSPLLRHICRSEKARDTSRRTNRSHYLRYQLPNTLNTNEYFNMQCSIFQVDKDDEIV